MVFGQYRVLNHFGSYQQQWYKSTASLKDLRKTDFGQFQPIIIEACGLLYEYDVITGLASLAAKMYE